MTRCTCGRTQVMAVTASTLNMAGGRFFKLLKRSPNAEHPLPEEVSMSSLSRGFSSARSMVAVILMTMRA